MPINDGSLTGYANGDIHPAVALMIDTSANNRVIEATAGARCIGISVFSEHKDPSNSDGLAASAGEAIKYWGAGSKDVPARLGAAGCTAGDRLKATTAGRLVTASADGDEYVAIAKMTGVANDVIPVDVVIGQRGA